MDDVVLCGKQAYVREPCKKLVVEELVEALARDRNAEQEEPDEHGQLVRVADPMQVRRQLGRSEQKVIAGGEPLLDSSCLVAREAESPRNLDGDGQIRRGRIRACDERCARRFYSPSGRT